MSHVKLTASLPEDEVVSCSFAGWESRLTMMEAAAARVSTKFQLDRFKSCPAEYERQVQELVRAEIKAARLG